MIWIWATLCAVLAAAVGGFLIWRGTLNKGELAALDINLARHITERFPAILKQAPDPALKAAKAGAGLQGNLGQTPLHDLLQSLSLGHKSGILEVASGRRTGRIVFKDGRVYKDSYRGKDGMEAL